MGLEELTSYKWIGIGNRPGADLIYQRQIVRGILILNQVASRTTGFVSSLMITRKGDAPARFLM